MNVQQAIDFLNGMSADEFDAATTTVLSTWTAARRDALLATLVRGATRRCAEDGVAVLREENEALRGGLREALSWWAVYCPTDAGELATMATVRALLTHREVVTVDMYGARDASDKKAQNDEELSKSDINYLRVKGERDTWKARAEAAEAKLAELRRNLGHGGV